MKLLNSFGPNPRAVRMFVLEKGMDLPTEDLDLLAGENRAEPYLKKNPGGQMPALELDDGSVLAETTAMCEYLEDKHPSPALIGSTPEEKAETRMWQRRIELQITEHMYNGFRYAEGLDLFKTRMHCLPEAAAGLKEIVQEKLTWLDGLMEGKQFIPIPEFTAIGYAVGAQINDVVTGEKSVKAALEGAQSQTQIILERAGYFADKEE